jgi:nifR3 family TIM-barrel protein
MVSVEDGRRSPAAAEAPRSPSLAAPTFRAKEDWLPVEATQQRYRQLLAETPVIAAPMCGISDFPYRAICRRMGARLTFTQMVSAEAIWRGDRKTLEILDLDGGEEPIGMQLFGGEPEALAHSAQVLQDQGAAIVDLNMGCPARKITVSNAGSALLRDLPRVGRIFAAMRRVTRVPLTAKMRWDWGEGSDGRGAALEVARMAADEGLDGLCLHARTREQGYSGAANWELIAAMKAAAPNLPVVGNGDIRSPADALSMMARSGCDAVMIGRAVIGDPWLLRAVLEAVRSGRAPMGDCAADWPTRRTLMLDHARMMFERRGARGLVQFRKHAACYLRGLAGAKRLRTELMTVATLEQLESVMGESRLDWPEPASAEA